MRYSRQNKILELVNTMDIGTQEKLASLLRDSGFLVTQATISRDIKDLQLIKVLSGDGKYKYIVGNSEKIPLSARLSRIFKETIKSVTPTQGIVILKTLPGCAKAAGEAIDSLNFSYIVGSIAGDNTIAVFVDEQDHLDYVVDIFNKMMS
ncbi:MAG: arginine repressor [Eubacteriales bacterium]